MLEQHAGRHPLEEVDRQPHQVTERLGRGRDVDFVGRKQQQIVPQIFEAGVEQDRSHDPHPQHVQRLVGPVDQHLVHHDLEEERRNQRDRVDHQHRQRDLPEQPPEFQEFRNEPA
ncbi:hypothetical protein SDC9_195927 [bioreactor metagenome]|uniref:Uncharacterized protein n=1 Tax=bioreactor metagenome TaxID=1076179 RepID=A0A645IB21_9ZZZZ